MVHSTAVGQEHENDGSAVRQLILEGRGGGSGSMGVVRAAALKVVD